MLKKKRLHACGTVGYTNRLRQHGISLLTVLVFVLLTMLLTLWASRTSLFNEMVVGNDADYQRAFEAAQALLQDAELDIQMKRADGTLCHSTGGAAPVCRSGGGLQIPIESYQAALLMADLAQMPAGRARCKDGLCLKRSRAEQHDFWSDDADFSNMRSKGVRYGTYTGAAKGSINQPGNPILHETKNDKGGWYWIEILPYLSTDAVNLISDLAGSRYRTIRSDPMIVYRITVITTGRKEGTRVVLQQVYAKSNLGNFKG